ncbi:hypothetical protein DV738_g3086, partial [Chaetothyriales sp. CBS 135597]
MARPGTVQQPPLSLTEELEKVEQQITLTLQEIDRNFSHAHRVVTSSILPVVEQYAVHSKHVWQGSQFWKQFFESSANVSLSGYEEDASLQTEQLDETTITTSTDDASLQTEQLDEATATITTASTEPATVSHSRLETSESFSTPSAHTLSTSSVAELDISNLSLSPSKSSTPRPQRQRQRAVDQTTTFADYPSPYEALQDEVDTGTKQKERQNIGQDAGPTTPLSVQRVTTTPQSGSSPFVLPPAPTSILRQQKTDPLLCRVLDRNYRIQATPLTTRKHGSPIKSARGIAYNVATTTPAQYKRAVADPAFSSSPMATPQLHEELFSATRKQPSAATGVVQRQQADYGDPPFEMEEASPSVVRKAVGLEDETF